MEINKKTFQTHDLILMAAILNLVIFLSYYNVLHDKCTSFKNTTLFASTLRCKVNQNQLRK